MTGSSLLTAVPDGMPWVGALIAIGVCVATLIKAWSVLRKVELDAAGARRKVEMDSETAMINVLSERVAKLEEKVELERTSCDERIERIEERHDAQVAALEGQVQVLRHDRNNVRQALNAMFAMIKRLDNDELSGIVASVEEMLTRGDQAIAVEKAAVPMAKGMRR